MAISAFTAVAWYNVAQLNVSIFMTFKRRRGLYFWSLLISSYGVVFHALGFLLKFFQLTTNDYLSCFFITLGWLPMVTGQALVLYSRLHLVVKEQRILRGVLIMIVWNAITLHIPTTVLTFGSSSPAWRYFINGFQVMEKIQMTIFCIQEFIISGLYMWATVRLLKPVYRRRTRSVMQQLIWINVFIFVMDISLLLMEYVGNYEIEATLKSMIYSIKLTLEFSVLNQLMRLANSNNSYNTTIRDDGNDGADSHTPKSRKGPLRHITKVLPHKAPFYDEKHSDISSSRPNVPAGTPALGSPGCSVPSAWGNSLACIDTDDSTRVPNLDRHQRPSVHLPSLALDAGMDEQCDNSSGSTIINNPAAFMPDRRPPRDPYTLDGLSPIVATPVTSPPEPQSYFSNLKQRNSFPGVRPNSATVNTGTSNDISPEASPTTPVRPTNSRNPSGTAGSRTSRFSALLSLPRRLTSGSEVKIGTQTGPLSPPDLQLLKSRRPSVDDWAAYRSDPGDASYTSSETRLELNDRAKRSTRPPEAKRFSARGEQNEIGIIDDEDDDSEDEDDWTRPGPSSTNDVEMGMWHGNNHVWKMVKKEDADKKMQAWDKAGDKEKAVEEGRSGQASGGGHEFVTSAL